MKTRNKFGIVILKTLNMKDKETKSLICYVAIAIVTVAFLMSATSCASRKTDRKEEKQKIDFTEQFTSETQTRAEITSVTVDTSTIEEIEIVPIDSTKPIEYNGHKVINGTLKLSKRKNNIRVDKAEKVAQIQRKQAKRELKVDNSNKAKGTTKPDAPIVSTWKNIWFILELVFYLFLLIAIYYVYKKYIQPRLNNKNNFLP